MDFNKPSKLNLFLFNFRTKVLLKNFYKKYVESMGLNGDEKVLEFGCGTGAMSVHLARFLNNGVLCCLDPSEKMIDETKKSLKKYNNVIYIKSEIDSADLKKDFFDIIVVHFVLHDISKEKRNVVINRFYEILKDGGKIFIREPIKHEHGIKEEEIIDLMQKSGFKKGKTEYQKHFLRPDMISGVFIK